MAQFLKTLEINSKILEIIELATNRVVLVSPYLQFSDDWLGALQHAANRKVTIIVVYGKKRTQPTAKDQLAMIAGVELYFMKNLHAKCYFNEQLMIISSMNLYASSAARNKEMGVLLDRITDPQAFQEAVEESKAYYTPAQRELLLPPVNGGDGGKEYAKGRCIACAKPTVFDPARPLCIECYRRLSATTASHFLEKYCHQCGIQASTSLWYPICPPCTREQSVAVKVTAQNKNTAR